VEEHSEGASMSKSMTKVSVLGSVFAAKKRFKALGEK